VIAEAREAFGGTLGALGRPTPPTSPEKDWWGPVIEAPVDVVADRFGDGFLRRLGAALDGPKPSAHVGPHG
jgi:hypothetical protein